MCECGGNCPKYLKRGVEQKRGGETKILKWGGKLGQGVGALKRGGGLEPTYVLCIFILFIYMLNISFDGEINTYSTYINRVTLFYV